MSAENAQTNWLAAWPVHALEAIAPGGSHSCFAVNSANSAKVGIGWGTGDCMTTARYLAVNDFAKKPLALWKAPAASLGGSRYPTNAEALAARWASGFAVLPVNRVQRPKPAPLAMLVLRAIQTALRARSPRRPPSRPQARLSRLPRLDPIRGCHRSFC